MNPITQLDVRRHQSMKIDPNRVTEHAADQRMMPIVISEFQNCAIHFPIIVTKNADSGAFVCVALFGFDAGENLFWKQARWDALYTPLNIRRQPFSLGVHTEQETNNYVLCIDEQSPSVNHEEGVPLFTSEGQASDYLKQAQGVLQDLLRGEAESKLFVDELVALDLLAPLSFDITFKNDQSQSIGGAYTISEEKMAQLSDAQILRLHKSGYLGLIFTMFVSLGQLYPLIERKNDVLMRADSWFTAAEV